MKRILLFIFTSFLIITAYPEGKGFSRWSFTPEYGYNYFDGDINQNLTNLFPTSFRNITYGASVEYAMTPIWGLSLDYYFFPLRANNNSPAPISINTDLSTSDFNATINFTRWIFPNSKSKFYVNGSIGIGFAYYTFNVKYANGSPVLASDTYVDQKYNGQIRPILLFQNNIPLKYGLAGSVPVTLSVEYNLSKPIAFGAKIHYRAYTKDNLEGVTNLNWDGVTNDFIAAGTLFLRYKFNSKKKNHLRNISWDVYQPDEGLVLAKNLEKRFDKLKGKVDSIGTKVDSLMPRVARLENILSNDGPDSDGDGVPDVRDLEPNTPTNSLVDFWGRTLKIPDGNNSSSEYEDNVPVSRQNGMNKSGIFRENDDNFPARAQINQNNSKLTENYKDNISTSNKTGHRHNENNPPANEGNVPGGTKTNQIRTQNPREHIYDAPAVYFDFDRIDLDDNALVTISKIAAKMKTDPDLYVEVRGYCDYAGNNPYNNLLSQRRSDRVKAELVNIWKIPFDHIISNGKGKVIEPRLKYRPNRRCDFFFGRL